MYTYCLYVYIHNNLLNALVIHRKEFNHNFEFANTTLSKEERNLLRRKIIKGFAIESYQSINLRLGFFPKYCSPERIITFPCQDTCPRN